MLIKGYLLACKALVQMRMPEQAEQAFEALHALDPRIYTRKFFQSLLGNTPSM